MKIKTIQLICLCALIFGSGCGIIPKNVEFFQKKVKAVPTKSDAAYELDRKAAKYIWANAEEAYLQAMNEGSSSNVLTPLENVSKVAPALSTSLGPPSKEWYGKAVDLAEDLNSSTAKLNRKIDDYRDDTKPLEGKKIEGTGLFQMSYFTYLALVLGVLYLIKTGVNIYAQANPAVGLGLNALRIPGKAAAKGLGEVIEGGENFLKKLDDEITDSALKEKVVDLFKSAHKEKQSRDVQQVVNNLTKS